MDYPCYIIVVSLLLVVMYSKTLVAIFGVAFFATLANAQATGSK